MLGAIRYQQNEQMTSFRNSWELEPETAIPGGSLGLTVGNTHSINKQKLASFWREKVGFGDDTVSFMRALSVAYEALARKKHKATPAILPVAVPLVEHANGR